MCCACCVDVHLRCRVSSAPVRYAPYPPRGSQSDPYEAPRSHQHQHQQQHQAANGMSRAHQPRAAQQQAQQQQQPATQARGGAMPRAVRSPHHPPVTAAAAAGTRYVSSSQRRPHASRGLSPMDISPARVDRPRAHASPHHRAAPSSNITSSAQVTPQIQELQQYAHVPRAGQQRSPYTNQAR